MSGNQTLSARQKSLGNSRVSETSWSKDLTTPSKTHCLFFSGAGETHLSCVASTSHPVLSLWSLVDLGEEPLEEAKVATCDALDSGDGLRVGEVVRAESLPSRFQWQSRTYSTLGAQLPCCCSLGSWQGSGGGGHSGPQPSGCRVDVGALVPSLLDRGNGEIDGHLVCPDGDSTLLEV